MRRAKKAKIGLQSLSYAESKSILVIGDGDFSFSVGLVRHLEAVGWQPAAIVATSYDSLDVVLRKYSTTTKNLDQLCLPERVGYVTIRHGVDATCLEKTFHVADSAFERIIFNFPHTGKQRVHLNRALVVDFLKSAAVLIKRPSGRIHVTLKMKYATWHVDGRALTVEW